MRLTTRVQLSLGGLVVLVIVMAVGGFMGLTFAEKLAAYYPERLLPGTVKAKNIAIRTERYLLAILDPGLREEIDFVSLRQAIDDEVQGLHDSIFDPGKEPPRKDVAEVVNDLSAGWKALKEIDPERPGAQDKIRAAFRNMEVSIQAVDSVVGSLATDSSARIQSTIGTVNKVLMVVGLIAIVLGMVVGVLLSRAVNLPLRDLENTMHRIADANDLTQRADAQRKDEFGEISRSFNGVIGRLQQLVTQVAQTSERVHSSAGGLATNAEQLRRSAAEQSDAVNRNAAATEELTVSIATVAETAADVRQKSQESIVETNDGNRKVGELVAEIDVIQSNVNRIAETVAEFVKCTGSISGLTQEVRDIADQTNLLALNAAIEAARAGEHGRGFAVVADEVRKLAEKSGISAGQIDSVAREIIQNSEVVNAAISTGLGAIAQSASLAADVEHALTDARRSVEDAGSGVDEIAAAVAEQKLASTDIAQNMEKIALSAEEAAQTAHHMDASAGSLSQAARDLKQAISGFRI